MQYICIYIYIFIYLYIYIYIYISVYIYIYLYMYIYIQYIFIYILKKRTQRSVFFCKITKRSRILLRSLQKNEMFPAFFYVLCKRTLRSLRSFTFLRKECKRTHRSFGSHKSQKTCKKEHKRMLRSLKECIRTMRSEQERTRCPTLGNRYNNME